MHTYPSYAYIDSIVEQQSHKYDVNKANGERKQARERMNEMHFITFDSLPTAIILQKTSSIYIHIVVNNERYLNNHSSFNKHLPLRSICRVM